MDINGSYLTIESVKKVSKDSFLRFITINLLNFIEENRGDFTILDTDSGRDHLSYLLSCYEDGERI